MYKTEIGLKEKIHFIGIGGIGMSGLAQVMKTIGFKVQGSDISQGKNIERCKKIGIKIFPKHNKKNIKNCTIIVKSSAIKNNNPEIIAAKKKKLTILKRSEMLAHVVSLKKNIVITGSHGKTTTTSLIAKILSQADLDPTIINGGVVNSLKGSAKVGKGDWAVLEADESDGTFLNLPINYSVVTNLDREHLDFYKSFKKLKECFVKFVNKTPGIGKSFICIDDKELRKILPKIHKKNFLTYGFSKKSNFQILNTKYKSNFSTFDLGFMSSDSTKKIIRKIKINLIGKHNVLNAAAAVSLCLHLGIKLHVIKNSLKKFTGIDRRLTKVFQIKEREFYDDYAHHPTEIKSVLRSIRTTSKNRKIVSVFQPHRYSRLKSLKKDFSSSFKDSNYVILCPVYPAGEKIDKSYSDKDFAKLIAINSKVQVAIVNNAFDLKKFFIKNLINNEIVICMGAGSISNWIRTMDL